MRLRKYGPALEKKRQVAFMRKSQRKTAALSHLYSDGATKNWYHTAVKRCIVLAMEEDIISLANFMTVKIATFNESEYFTNCFVFFR